MGCFSNYLRAVCGMGARLLEFIMFFRVGKIVLPADSPVIRAAKDGSGLMDITQGALVFEIATMKIKSG